MRQKGRDKGLTPCPLGGPPRARKWHPCTDKGHLSAHIVVSQHSPDTAALGAEHGGTHL